MIGIIDYGMGNLRSVEKAFVYLGFDAGIIKTPDEIKQCEKIVLPGVGAFGDAIAILRRGGLDKAVKNAVSEGRLFLGICLGMQLMFDESSEGGRFEGLKLLSGRIVRLDEDPSVKYGGTERKIPHMGWNSLDIKRPSPLFEGLGGDPFVYFDHAYYLETDSDIVSATCFYGKEINAAAQSGNVFGAQFHPEKSGAAGLKILENFAKL
ncbi:MAG: imidazole glycerol phosphate synthase subunit HisH [Clostridiales bacterium]|jgi:glutamine amidotransferase|nr:imidazole glycerol phosphate synthase subunit HisH [Clostridiales bacterium]